MPVIERTRKFLQELIETYEARVAAVIKLIGTTHELLDTCREKRIKLSDELKETLARVESLRCKDFDHMMRETYLFQQIRERELKKNLKTFLENQREITQLLKLPLREEWPNNDIKCMEDFKVFFSEITHKYNLWQKRISDMVQDFYQEQKNLSRELENLLAKGDTLQIKDVKCMLKKFHQDNPKNMKNNGNGNETIQLNPSHLAEDIPWFAEKKFG